MKVITLGGKPVQLRPPLSYATRTDIALAAHTNVRRAWAAALGACWSSGSDGNPNRDGVRYRGDALDYGGAIMDLLRARGIGDTAIRDAGGIAFDILTEGLIWEEDVKIAEGNSETPEAGDGVTIAASPSSSASAAGIPGTSPAST